MKKILLALAFVFAPTTGLLAAATTHTVDAEITPLADNKTHVKADLATLKHNGDNAMHNEAVKAYLTPSEELLNDAAHQAEIKAAADKMQKMTLKITATDKDGKVDFEIEQLRGKIATMFGAKPAALNPAFMMMN